MVDHSLKDWQLSGIVVILWSVARFFKGLLTKRLKKPVPPCSLCKDDAEVTFNG